MPNCCTHEWSSLCSDIANNSCNACDSSYVDCCKPNGTPGCGQPEISQCVCGIDPNCCFGIWDLTCSRYHALCATSQPTYVPWTGPVCQQGEMVECNESPLSGGTANQSTFIPAPQALVIYPNGTCKNNQFAECKNDILEKGTFNGYCDGIYLVTCSENEPVNTDCTALGYTKCDYVTCQTGACQGKVTAECVN
jgi:hypothetical protein